MRPVVPPGRVRVGGPARAGGWRELQHPRSLATVRVDDDGGIWYEVGLDAWPPRLGSPRLDDVTCNREPGARLRTDQRVLAWILTQTRPGALHSRDLHALPARLARTANCLAQSRHTPPESPVKQRLWRPGDVRFLRCKPPSARPSAPRAEGTPRIAINAEWAVRPAEPGL